MSEVLQAPACLRCGKPCPPRRKKYCSKYCCDRAAQVAWQKRNLDKCRAWNNASAKRRYRRDPDLKERLQAQADARRGKLSPEERLEKNRRYYKTRLEKHGAEKLRQDQREYVARKRAADPQYKLRASLQCRISKAIRRAKGLKSWRTEELLGCTVAQARQHLESLFQPGMSWDNYGDWHIDHIRPCDSFDLTDPEQQKQCFHYTNLQPLWAEDNLKKGAKWEAA